MSSKPIAEGVKLQGILADGYGLIPRAVVRDERLSAEAKAIYSYLSALSGASYNPVFPSRELMLKELGMSINRFYKHMQQLVDCNYVVIERSMEGNIFGKNIYSLVLVPDMAKDTVRVKRPAKIKKRLDRKVERQEEEKTAADKPAPSADPGVAPDRKGGSAGGTLRAQLGIDSLLEKKPESKKLISSILMVIEDMAMSEQITINGCVKKKSAIKHLLGSLRMDHIETLVNNITASGQKIKNKRAYILSCIGNVIFDESPLNFSKDEKEQQEKDLVAEEEIKRKEQYIKNPELKEIDEKITAIMVNISKALLSGNEERHKSLLAEKNRLLEQWESIGEAV